MNVFELFAVLTLQKDDYEKGLNDTEKKANTWGDKIKGIMQSKAVASFALVVKAIVEVGQKLNQLMNDTLRYADQIGDLGAKLGVSAESISETAYVAGQLGTDINTVTNSMSMLYMRAKENGEAFQELGVNVKDANGEYKAMDVLFWETAEALNSLENEGERSKYMLETFGRSAMQVGEILRQDSGDLTRLRQEAHELGIVLDQTTADFAGSWFDKIDQVKMQGQTALASLIAGAPDAEEKLQDFIDNLMKMLETYIPTFANFVIRLAIQAAISLRRVVPSLVIEVLNAIIDTIFSVNWLQVGIDMGRAIAEGVVNVVVSALNLLVGWTGFKIPKVDFGVGESVFPQESLGEEYEISEKINQTIEVKVEASGDTPVSEETAEKTAQALAPYIDKILGGV